MLVRLRLDGRRPRRWHGALIARLSERGVGRVEVDARPGSGAWPRNADRLFGIEGLLNGLPGDGPAAPMDSAAVARWPRPAPGRPDLVIHLCRDVGTSLSSML